MDRYLEIWGTYAAEGFEAFLKHVADDVVVEEYTGVPGAQVWHGKDGFRTMWQRWEEGFDGFAFEPRGAPEVLAEDVFATPVRVRGTGKASGIAVDWNLIMVSVLRNGLIAQQFLVDTLEEARARLA